MSTFASPNDQNPLTRVKANDINALDAATANAFALLPDETRVRLGTVQYALDTGLVNAYAVALPQTATAYVDGMLVSMMPATSNTAAATINVNALGAKSIRQYNGAVLNANDIVQGCPVELRYSASTGFFHRTGSGPAGATGATGATGSVGTLANGSKAAPSLAYASEPGTGWWLEAAGRLAASIAGEFAFRMRSNFTAFGLKALNVASVATSGNVAIGTQSQLLTSTGNSNVSIGDGTLGANTTTGLNTAIGDSALATATAAENTAVGSSSMVSTTTGQQNVAVGRFAGQSGTANTIGSNNTWIGYAAGSDANNRTNVTVIGNGAASTKDNQVVLGNGSVIEWAPGADGTVALGSSARHFKGLYADYTITAVVGNVTINKMAGNAIMGAGTTSVTVTNSLVTANSIVMVIPKGPVQVNAVPYVTPAAGSFQILANGGYASNQEFRWFIVNTD